MRWMKSIHIDDENERVNERVQNVIRMTHSMNMFKARCMLCALPYELNWNFYVQQEWYMVQVYIITYFARSRLFLFRVSAFMCVCCVQYWVRFFSPGSIHSRPNDVGHKKRKLMRFIWHSFFFLFGRPSFSWLFGWLCVIYLQFFTHVHTLHWDNFLILVYSI